MPQFPSEVFTPREIENRPGVEYDAEKKRILYAEDINKITDELVAIQSALLPEPVNPIPYGFEVGQEGSRFKIISMNIGDIVLPIIESAIQGMTSVFGFITKVGVAVLAGPDDYASLAFYANDLSNSAALYFADDYDEFVTTKNLNMYNGGGLSGFRCTASPIGGGYNTQVDVMANGITRRLEISNDLGVDGIVASNDYIHGQGYKSADGSDGLTTTQNIITAIRVFEEMPQYKTQTQTFKNGLLVEQTTESEWTNLV